MDPRARVPDRAEGPRRRLALAPVRLRSSNEDSDIIRTLSIDGVVEAQLLELGGPGTTLAKRHGMFLEILPSGFPFLRQRAVWLPQQSLSALRHFRIEALSTVDVAVSKLARFAPNDVEDIHGLVERKLVTHAEFVECFRAAVDVRAFSAYDEDIPRYVRNFHRVEEHAFGVASTPIDLPPHLED